MSYTELENSKLIDGWKRTTHNDPNGGIYNPIYLHEINDETMKDPLIDLLREEHKHYCLSGVIGIRPGCEIVRPLVLSFDMLDTMFHIEGKSCTYNGGNNGTVQVIYVFCLPSWRESQDLSDLCSQHVWGNMTPVINRLMTDLQPAEITDVIDTFTTQAARDISRTISSLNRLQETLDDYQRMHGTVARLIYDHINSKDYEVNQSWYDKYKPKKSEED